MNPEVKQAISEGLAKRSEFEQRLIMKAWEDETFRQELLTNPKAVFAREAGQQIPEGFAIEIIEETPGTIKMVLPKNPAPVIAEGELSEEALEAVAGGGWIGGSSRSGGWVIATN